MDITKLIADRKELKKKLAEVDGQLEKALNEIQGELTGTKPAEVLPPTNTVKLPEGLSPKREQIWKFCNGTAHTLTEINKHTGGAEFTTVQNMVNDKQLKRDNKTKTYLAI